MTEDQAGVIALKALGWLAGNDELLSVFMGATGVLAEDFRTRAGDADFQASVLDFILMDDAWVIAFGDAAATPYEDLAHARQSLPGGAVVNWT